MNPDWPIIALIVALLLFVCLLAAAPGSIARKRGHRAAAAISLCGWLGLLVWPLWFVALIWAYTEKSNGETERKIEFRDEWPNAPKRGAPVRRSR